MLYSTPPPPIPQQVDPIHCESIEYLHIHWSPPPSTVILTTSESTPSSDEPQQPVRLSRARLSFEPETDIVLERFLLCCPFAGISNAKCSLICDVSLAPPTPVGTTLFRFTIPCEDFDEMQDRFECGKEEIQDCGDWESLLSSSTADDSIAGDEVHLDVVFGHEREDVDADVVFLKKRSGPAVGGGETKSDEVSVEFLRHLPGNRWCLTQRVVLICGSFRPDDEVEVEGSETQKTAQQFWIEQRWTLDERSEIFRGSPISFVCQTENDLLVEEDEQPLFVEMCMKIVAWFATNKSYDYPDEWSWFGKRKRFDASNRPAKVERARQSWPLGSSAQTRDVDDQSDDDSSNDEDLHSPPFDPLRVFYSILLFRCSIRQEDGGGDRTFGHPRLFRHIKKLERRFETIERTREASALEKLDADHRLCPSCGFNEPRVKGQKVIGCRKCETRFCCDCLTREKRRRALRESHECRRSDWKGKQTDLPGKRSRFLSFMHTKLRLEYVPRNEDSTSSDEEEEEGEAIGGDEEDVVVFSSERTFSRDRRWSGLMKSADWALTLRDDDGEGGEEDGEQ